MADQFKEASALVEELEAKHAKLVETIPKLDATKKALLADIDDKSRELAVYQDRLDSLLAQIE